MPSIVRDIFEKYVIDEFGLEDCIAVNNGTSALIAPLWSMDLSPGDEIITTPFTFIATTNAILIAGGTPVFVDIDPETFEGGFKPITIPLHRKAIPQEDDNGV